MKINIKHIAKLANLKLSIDEEKKFEKQLLDILGYIKNLNELDIKDIELTSQVTGLENIYRDDNEIHPSFSQEDALRNTKSQHNGLFKVKAILENK